MSGLEEAVRAHVGHDLGAGEDLDVQFLLQLVETLPRASMKLIRRRYGFPGKHTCSS